MIFLSYLLTCLFFLNKIYFSQFIIQLKLRFLFKNLKYHIRLLLKSYKYLQNIKNFYKWEKRKPSKNKQPQLNNNILINLQAELIKNLKKPPKNNNQLQKNTRLLEKPRPSKNNKSLQRL